jgi:hypothetical protein
MKKRENRRTVVLFMENENRIYSKSMKISACSKNSYKTNQNPEPIQQGVCAVLSNECTPGKQNSIDGIECPHKQERAFRTHPAYKCKTDYAHDNTQHFYGFNILFNKVVEWLKHRFRLKIFFNPVINDTK